MATAYVAIGANLGDPLSQAQGALSHIAQLPSTRIVTVSSWYRSKAIGPEQPDYLNGVACIETTLPPIDLLDGLQQVELAQGRRRLQHWGPRTLDLDLLLYDDVCLHSERLTLPHAQLALRNFVVVPLLEIAPQLTLPDGRTLAAIAVQLGGNGLARWQQNQ
jgi:2-amino-4-hydroxy-6-hydroxymethyldihydropteridine diphosphokinase